MTSASVRSDWEGVYLDGRTPARQRAQIRLMRGGLEVSTESGATLWWPYGEVRQTQGSYAGEQVRLERGGDLPEALLVADADFLASLHGISPEVASRFHDPGRRRRRVALTVLAAIAVVAIAAGLYVWGIPAAAAVAAARVPVSWEERFGRSIVEHLVPAGKACAEPTRQRIIDDIVKALIAPLPRTPYTFRVTVVDDPTVNALAAPGGFIVVFRGLLERTRTPEELAGVLAHEIQHVLQRHATKALVQHVSTGLLFTALTGDVSGVMAYGLESARVLATLRYSRAAEEEADAGGMRLLLAARIDPAGMIAFFEGMEKRRGEAPGLLTYLSTHPAPEERVARLTRLARAPVPAPSRKLLDGYDWADIRRICG